MFVLQFELCDLFRIFLEYLFCESFVLGVGFCGGVLNFYLVFVIKRMHVGAGGHALALNFLEEELTIFHGAEQAPEGASID